MSVRHAGVARNPAGRSARNLPQIVPSTPLTRPNYSAREEPNRACRESLPWMPTVEHPRAGVGDALSPGWRQARADHQAETGAPLSSPRNWLQTSPGWPRPRSASFGALVFWRLASGPLACFESAVLHFFNMRRPCPRQQGVFQHAASCYLEPKRRATANERQWTQIARILRKHMSRFDRRISDFVRL